MNCLSELVEATGGHIDMSQLPVGDPTLSAKEIVGNESGGCFPCGASVRYACGLQEERIRAV